MVYILFLIGIVLLIKGADWLVEGASSIASRFGVSELVVGLTVVSFGTSMPELVVNLLASFNGSSELAIGNVVGSNIANVLLILGVAAIVRPLAIQKSIYFTEIPISLMATFMVGFLANADLFVSGHSLSLSRMDGVILLVFFSLFMAYIFVVSKSKEPGLQEAEPTKASPESDARGSIPKAALWIGLGVMGLFLGGKWVVEGAVFIAQSFGLSETLIGLTVVAIGTSLPELVTSAVAAYKGQAGMAVGNVIGSNIFNLLWILGLSAVINPLPFDVATNSDILMIIIASTLPLIAVIVGRKPRINRFEGVIFIGIYIAYVVYLIQRG